MIYTRKFYSKNSFNSFVKKLHPNRVVAQYHYIESVTSKTVFCIKYFRSTKALKKKYNF